MYHVKQHVRQNAKLVKRHADTWIIASVDIGPNLQSLSTLRILRLFRVVRILRGYACRWQDEECQRARSSASRGSSAWSNEREAVAGGLKSEGAAR